MKKDLLICPFDQAVDVGAVSIGAALEDPVSSVRTVLVSPARLLTRAFCVVRGYACRGTAIELTMGKNTRE